MRSKGHSKFRFDHVFHTSIHKKRKMDMTNLPHKYVCSSEDTFGIPPDLLTVIRSICCYMRSFYHDSRAMVSPTMIGIACLSFEDVFVFE